VTCVRRTGEKKVNRWLLDENSTGVVVGWRDPVVQILETEGDEGYIGIFCCKPLQNQ